MKRWWMLVLAVTILLLGVTAGTMLSTPKPAMAGGGSYPNGVMSYRICTIGEAPLPTEYARRYANYYFVLSSGANGIKLVTFWVPAPDWMPGTKPVPVTLPLGTVQRLFVRDVPGFQPRVIPESDWATGQQTGATVKLAPRDWRFAPPIPGAVG